MSWIIQSITATSLFISTYSHLNEFHSEHFGSVPLVVHQISRANGVSLLGLSSFYWTCAISNWTSEYNILPNAVSNFSARWLSALWSSWKDLWIIFSEGFFFFFSRITSTVLMNWNRRCVLIEEIIPVNFQTQNTLLSFVRCIFFLRQSKVEVRHITKYTLGLISSGESNERNWLD